MEPKTLLQAVEYFKDPANCREYLVPRRWPNGVTCPTCGSESVTFSEKHNRWQCNVHHDRRQFTLKTGTVMEDSPLGLDKWLPAIWLICSNRNGISSWELHRALGITQKSAWFLLHRVRLAMQEEDAATRKLFGEIEIDESFIGGKARNMHKDVRARKIRSQAGSDGKEIVLGMRERQGRVRAIHVEKRSKPVLQHHVREHVEAGAAIYTDALQSYDGLTEFEHGVVDHAVEYVNGNAHTNGMENYWSLLKRTLKGTYVSVEPFHLFRYLDEQSFRYNNRLPMKDSDRFGFLVRKIVGKRLTYKQLTGKEHERHPAF